MKERNGKQEKKTWATKIKRGPWGPCTFWDLLKHQADRGRLTGEYVLPLDTFLMYIAVME